MRTVTTLQISLHILSIQYSVVDVTSPMCVNEVIIEIQSSPSSIVPYSVSTRSAHGEWKLYSWLKVLAQVVNLSVELLPPSVTQRPVCTCLIVQPSAISELVPQLKQSIKKFCLLKYH
jgi:hypothetical protein